MDENRIASLMKSLHCSREDAIQVIMDDEAIDGGEKLFELTAEQKKAAKAMTATGTKKKGSTVKRERKPDEIKREVIATIAQNLDRCCFGEDLSTVENVAIANPEREITFKIGNDEYSVTLTKHRPPKK